MGTVFHIRKYRHPQS